MNVSRKLPQNFSPTSDMNVSVSEKQDKEK